MVDFGPVPGLSQKSTAGRPDSFLRVYRQLRLDLIGGARRPGDQIVVTDTAQLLATSPTPIREALARLAGERLVEDRRHHGFYVPLPSRFDLLELYELCEIYLGSAMRSTIRRGGEAELHVRDPAPRIEPEVAQAMADDMAGLAHLAILTSSTNASLVAAGRSVIDRLAAARRLDAIHSPEEAGKAAQALEELRIGVWRNALVWIRADFRGRRGRAESVAHMLAAEHRERNRHNIV